MPRSSQSIYISNFHSTMFFLNITDIFFFFNDTATTEIYTLSLHDALPISEESRCSTLANCAGNNASTTYTGQITAKARDRKSTRLNSSHVRISYAVFCLKKKKDR